MRNLPRKFLARRRDPRPTVDFIPSGIGSNMSANACINCGATNDIYSGDNYVIRASSSCSWTFNVKRDVNIDVMCTTLDVPCSNAKLKFDFSFTSTDGLVCTTGVANNARISLRTRGFPYTLDMSLEPNGEYVSHN